RSVAVSQRADALTGEERTNANGRPQGRPFLFRVVATFSPPRPAWAAASWEEAAPVAAVRAHAHLAAAVAAAAAYVVAAAADPVAALAAAAPAAAAEVEAAAVAAPAAVSDARCLAVAAADHLADHPDQSARAARRVAVAVLLAAAVAALAAAAAVEAPEVAALAAELAARRSAVVAEDHLAGHLAVRQASCGVPRADQEALRAAAVLPEAPLSEVLCPEPRAAESHPIVPARFCRAAAEQSPERSAESPLWCAEWKQEAGAAVAQCQAVPGHRVDQAGRPADDATRRD